MILALAGRAFALKHEPNPKRLSPAGKPMVALTGERERPEKAAAMPAGGFREHGCCDGCCRAGDLKHSLYRVGLGAGRGSAVIRIG